MSRYTFKDLETDVANLNLKLLNLYKNSPDKYKDKKDKLLLSAERRNGYSALDLYLSQYSSAQTYSRVQNIFVGSPRDCYFHAMEYVLSHVEGNSADN